MEAMRLLEALGLQEWTIVVNEDPWCNWSTKTLYVFQDDEQCLLHEATHALIGGGHLPHFWTLFEAILDYYLGEELPPCEELVEYQARMKKHYLTDKN